MYEEIIKELDKLPIEELQVRVQDCYNDMNEFKLPNGALDGRKVEDMIKLQNTINLLESVIRNKIKGI